MEREGKLTLTWEMIIRVGTSKFIYEHSSKLISIPITYVICINFYEITWEADLRILLWTQRSGRIRPIREQISWTDGLKLKPTIIIHRKDPTNYCLELQHSLMSDVRCHVHVGVAPTRQLCLRPTKLCQHQCNSPWTKRV